MSPHFPIVKPRQIVKLLLAKGFEERRVTGSHHVFRHPRTGAIVPVPLHGNRDLKPGTLRSILKMAGVSLQELDDYLGR